MRIVHILAEPPKKQETRDVNGAGPMLTYGIRPVLTEQREQQKAHPLSMRTLVFDGRV